MRTDVSWDRTGWTLRWDKGWDETEYVIRKGIRGELQDRM